ncbi:hypothetical protein KKG41_04900 [Patescibacteria group bacterium]|nr:hypothetical protein [Patescibacteria group bacterium]
MSMAKKEELLGIFRSEQADRVNKFYKLMCVEARWPDHIIADCESYLKLEPKGRYVSRASQLIKLIKSTDFTVLGVKPMTEGDRQAIRQSYLSILHKSVSSSLAVLADTEKNLTDLDRKSLIELRAHLRWALTDKLIAQEEYDYLAAKLIEQNLP